MYPKSLIERFSADMLSNLYGNPHSASPSSQSSSGRIENCRLAALRLFNADPATFDLVFVASATAGIKLVMEAFRSQEGGFRYLYHRDSHTSLVGVRESASAGHRCFKSDDELEQWLRSRETRITPCIEDQGSDDATPVFPQDLTVDCDVDGSTSSSSSPESGSHDDRSSSLTSVLWGPSEAFNLNSPSDEESHLDLLAYPAQSNMNGRRLPLDWVHRLQKYNCRSHRRCYSLLDAAALVSTSPLDLCDPSYAPDFTVVSFYKMFGFPDLGALIVKKNASSLFNRRQYFGGGTVEMVTCLEEQWHAPKSTSLHDKLEDGTLPIHSINALQIAIEVHRELFGPFETISEHTARLTYELYGKISHLRHYNNIPLCQIYITLKDGRYDPLTQGPVIAFNMRNSAGSWLSITEIEKLASVHNIHLRSGGLCNPGGMAHALRLAPWELKENFSAGIRCGSESDLANGKPTGMLRVSLGPMSTDGDVENFASFLQEFFVDRTQPGLSQNSPPANLSGGANNLIVEQLTVYPIKSCAGWNVPHNTDWTIDQEGLAWDREWCLIHAGTGASLSQKRHPRMALIRPAFDFETGQLRIRYKGDPPKLPGIQEVAVSLSPDPSYFLDGALSDEASQVCGDKVTTRAYSSPSITKFFSIILGVPCRLARFPKSNGSTPSPRHTKPFFQPYFGPASEQEIKEPEERAQNSPLLFSNESPILTIFRPSLDKLYDEIAAKQHGELVPSSSSKNAANFRANIVLTPSASATNLVRPYAEDAWAWLQIGASRLQVLGPCRRCQMVCVHPQTAERTPEPFSTLAKTRRRDGKVWFGVHTRLETSKEPHRIEVSRTAWCPTVRVGETAKAFYTSRGGNTESRCS